MSVRFVALGDSTTLGMGDPRPNGQWRGFAALLAGAFGDDVQYTNLAVSGARAVDVRERQLQPAVAMKPALASLIVGVNDTMRSDFDVAEVRDHVLVSAGSLAAAGVTLLTVRLHDHSRVFGLPGVLARPLWQRLCQVNAVYDEAYERYGGFRVDLTEQQWVYRRESWSVDRLHPSEAGHRRMAHAYALMLVGAGWPVAQLPSLERDGAFVPSTAADAAWMLTKGVPWVARKIRDLGPWVVTMMLRETRGQIARRLEEWEDEVDSEDVDPAVSDAHNGQIASAL